jgi:hypothetical protein
MVSAVLPDLLITLNSVVPGLQRRMTPPTIVGSTLSTTKSFGRVVECALRLCRAGESAACSASVPSAEPPMPSTTRFWKAPRRAAAKAWHAARALRSSGRSRKPSCPAARPAFSAERCCPCARAAEASSAGSTPVSPWGPPRTRHV